MNIKIRIGVLAVVASVFYGSAFAQSSSDIDQIISQERANQIARQISDNIARRISIEVSDATRATLQQNASLGAQNPLAASADLNSLLPDSAWLVASWFRNQ